MKVKFVKTHPLAKVPVKKHGSDFCYDVYAATKEQISENVFRYGLGLSMQIERRPERVVSFGKNTNKETFVDFKDFCGNLSLDFRPRSSVWETGLVLSNCEGTIDEGYIGEIKAVFYKVAEGTPYEVGDRIGQIKVGFTLPIEFVQVDNLLETERGTKGYGSSGNK